ncbi:hypothetical protein JCM14469_01220 [Desulfatiferula olefinivorans]
MIIANPHVKGKESMTIVVGALPNGRKAGEPLASGMAPENGMDKKGSLSLINAMKR